MTNCALVTCEALGALLVARVPLSHGLLVAEELQDVLRRQVDLVVPGGQGRVPGGQSSESI